MLWRLQCSRLVRRWRIASSAFGPWMTGGTYCYWLEADQSWGSAFEILLAWRKWWVPLGLVFGSHIVTTYWFPIRWFHGCCFPVAAPRHGVGQALQQGRTSFGVDKSSPRRLALTQRYASNASKIWTIKIHNWWMLIQVIVYFPRNSLDCRCVRSII